MKQFIAGILVGATLLGTVWAAGELYSVEPFSENLTNEEVIACVKAGGDGALLFNLELDENSPYGYTAERSGQGCIKAVK